jgi:hypothetical protein
MKPMRKYQIRWVAGGEVEVYTFYAASASDARKAFLPIPGVRILSVELAPGSDDDAAPMVHPVSPPPRGPIAAAEEVPEKPDSKFTMYTSRRAK